MKQIVFVRHAEAETGSNVPDQERPLTPNGRAAASQQSRLIVCCHVRVQGIITSPAVRARETAEALAAGLPDKVPVEAADALYNKSSDVVLRFLQRLPDDLDTVLVVGHLPWVAQLVSLLVTESRDLFFDFPPGTLACVNLDLLHWEELEPGHGTLHWFMPPLLGDG